MSEERIIFPCRLCKRSIIIRSADDDSIWAGGVHVLHEDGLEPGKTGVGYSFTDWEVAVLGGFDRLVDEVRKGELRDPVCQYVFGARMLNDKFKMFAGHSLPHSRGVYDAWRTGTGPSPQDLPAEHDLRLGDSQVECICGSVWPLLMQKAVEIEEGEQLAPSPPLT